MPDKKATQLPQEEWILEPARRFVRYFIESNYILTLSIEGIKEQSKQAEVAGSSHLKQLFESLVNHFKETNERPAREELQKTVDLYMRLSFFAASEAEKEFPIIRSHTLVAFWAALEVFVDDLILAWLTNRPEALRSEGLSKLKISLAEFEILNHEERLMLLLEEMKRQSKSNLTRGVNQFENVLKIIGLDGNVDKELRDDLYQTQQMRNVIVHRGSVADKRFIDACPTLDLKVGDKVTLSESDYTRYRDCIEDYVICLTSRVTYLAGHEVMDNETIANIVIGPALEAMKPPIEISLL